MWPTYLETKEAKLICCAFLTLTLFRLKINQWLPNLHLTFVVFQDEKQRIEGLGGSVIYWGTWRVNGQLAVSRAIGNYSA